MRNKIIDFTRLYHSREFLRNKLERIKKRDYMLNDPLTANVALKYKAAIVRHYFKGKSPATIYKMLDGKVPIDLVKRVLHVNAKGWRSWKHDITRAYMVR